MKKLLSRVLLAGTIISLHGGNEVSGKQKIKDVITSKPAIVCYVLGGVGLASVGTWYFIHRRSMHQALIKRGNDVAVGKFLENIEKSYFGENSTKNPLSGHKRILVKKDMIIGAKQFEFFVEIQKINDTDQYNECRNQFEGFYKDLVAYNTYLISQKDQAWEVEKIISTEPLTQGEFRGIAFNTKQKQQAQTS